MEYSSGMFLNNLRLGHKNPDALNPVLRSWFWDYSERVTGVKFPKNSLKECEYSSDRRKKREDILNQSGLYLLK